MSQEVFHTNQDACSLEEENFQKWKKVQEVEKEIIRTLDCYPKTPERPPKNYTSHTITFPVNRKKVRKSKKPKLPTPRDSPVEFDESRFLLNNKSSKSKQVKVSSSKSIQRRSSCIEVSASSESKAFFTEELVCESSCYSSDDSGRGTCTASDASDHSGHYRPTRGVRFKRRNHFEGKFFDENLYEKEKQRNKIDILKAVKCNIAHKIGANDDEILDIIISLGQFKTFHHIEKLHWYVADVERITLLLNSLARRLARAELRILMSDSEDLDELRSKQDKIVEQLHDANDINNQMKEKLVKITIDIEMFLGVETKDEFVTLLNTKTKLLITLKEIEDKLKLYEVQLKI